MRVAGFDVKAYGRLVDFSATELDDHPVVVFLGDNESGKSTFFSFLCTQLFGFHPARRDLHDYDPWSGAVPEGSLDLVLSDGTHARIRRRLRSNPDGRYVVGDVEESIGNRPLPLVGRVSLPVYRGLHAITLDEAGHLSKAAWTELEERLLGGAAFPFLRPAREAAREQDEAANTLWREDRRGKPRSKAIEQEMKALKAARREASGRGERIEAVRGDRERLAAELEQQREERVTLKTRLELQDKLEVERGHLERLEKEIERHKAADDDDPADVALLEHAEELEAAVESAVEQRIDVRQLKSFEDEEQLLAGKVGTCVSEALEAAPDEAARAALVRMDATEVRRAIEAFVRMAGNIEAAEREERHATSARAELSSRAQPRDGDPTPAELDAQVDALRSLRDAEMGLRGVAAAETGRRDQALMGKWFVGGGLVAIAVGALTPTWLIVLLGVLLAIAGGFLLYRSRGADVTEADLSAAIAQSRTSLGLGADDDAETALESTLAAKAWITARVPDAEQLARADAAVRETQEERLRHEQDLDAVHAAFCLLLEDIPVAAGRLDLLDGELADDLICLQRAVVEHERVRAQRPAIQERIRERRQAVEVLAAGLERSLSDDPFADVRSWNRELTAARARAAGRTVRTDDLPRLVKEHGQHVNCVLELEAEFEAQLGATSSADLGTRDRVELEERLHTMEQERADRAQRLGRLEQEEENLLQQPGVDDLDGALAAHQDELDEVCRERDRRALLARILREAERRYRERHQPDVFRRASEHLRRISRGRYVGLDVSEDQGNPHLEVREAGESFPVRAQPPLSRGTLEQIHLSLRLALADQIDGDEPLPLVLDELFVNWDPTRTGEGLEVLRAISERRQVFLMTCHPALAARAEQEAGAKIVRLPPLAS